MILEVQSVERPNDPLDKRWVRTAEFLFGVVGFVREVANCVTG